MRFARTPGKRTLLCCVPLMLALGAEPAGAQVREVVVGVTPNCPYGITACWGGAYEALGRLEGVASVAGTPDAYNCTASVRLKGDRLPDPEAWASHFKAMVDQAYRFRGVEVTVVGTVEAKDAGLVLRVPGLEQPLALRPLRHKLQWNFKKEAPRQFEPDERDAYEHLMPAVKDAKAGRMKVQVTGPLMESERGNVLEVREFFPLAHDTDPRSEG